MELGDFIDKIIDESKKQNSLSDLVGAVFFGDDNSKSQTKLSTEKFIVRCTECGNIQYEQEKQRRWGGRLGPIYICNKCKEEIRTSDNGTCPACHSRVFYYDKFTTKDLKELAQMGWKMKKIVDNPIYGAVYMIKDHYNSRGTKTIRSSGYCPHCHTRSFRCPDCGEWTAVPENFNDMENSIKCNSCGTLMMHG